VKTINDSIMKDQVVIVSAPSGAGKTTIVKNLLAAIPELQFSVSACSRAKRPNETDGIDYFFISTQDFLSKIKNNEFLEWQEVYEGSYYGTLNSEIKRIWSMDKIVIFDVDVIGGINIKKIFRGKALSVFIMPPSIALLEERLRNRSTETEKSLKMRIQKATKEIEFAKSFDRIVLNDEISRASGEAVSIVQEFIHQ
jgi:guanylate kinase